MRIFNIKSFLLLCCVFVTSCAQEAQNEAAWEMVTEDLKELGLGIDIPAVVIRGESSEMRGSVFAHFLLRGPAGINDRLMKSFQEEHLFIGPEARWDTDDEIVWWRLPDQAEFITAYKLVEGPLSNRISFNWEQAVAEDGDEILRLRVTYTRP